MHQYKVNIYDNDLRMHSGNLVVYFSEQQNDLW